MRGVVFCLVLVAGCASRPPVATTGVAPVVTTSVAPVATTGVAPVATTGVAPVATTGVAPVATSGVAPVVTPAGAAANSASTAAPTAGGAGKAAPVDAAGRPVNRALVAQGFRPTNYRGQLYYCRKEKLTGSQFTQKVCLTEQEAALQERIAQDEMNKRNWAGKCLPPLCPKK